MICRDAGRVERWHTFPTLQSQTIADHSWHVLRIWINLFGPPEMDEVELIQNHDAAAEFFTGDVPFGAKKRWPHLKEALSRCEDEVPEHREFVGYNKVRLKVCDLIEMLEFAEDEVSLGNSRGHEILANVNEALGTFTSALRPQDQQRVADYITTERSKR